MNTKKGTIYNKVGPPTKYQKSMYQTNIINAINLANHKKKKGIYFYPEIVTG
jgi:hypothetical protein